MSDVSVLRVPAQLVIFRVGPTRYGLDIDAVQEILAPQPLTALAGSTDGMVGLVEVRKRVVPTFDLRWKFGVARPEHDVQFRLIMVQVEGGPVALLADGVDEVAVLPRDAYQPVNAPGTTSGLSYLRGVARWRDSLILWVDHHSLVPKGIAQAMAA